MTQQFVIDPLTIDAAHKIQQDNPDFAGKTMRVYLAGKGCDGFDYGVTFDDLQADDVLCDAGDHFKIICDPRTLEFVEGSTISWVNDQRGQGFLVENPNHRKYRGKFYKKPYWQERFKETLSPSLPLEPKNESVVPSSPSLD